MSDSKLTTTKNFFYYLATLTVYRLYSASSRQVESGTGNDN